MMTQQTKTTAEKITIPKLVKKYRDREKLTMITAYDYTMAGLVDEAGVDMVLIGDSLGMVIQGRANTLKVGIDEVVYHTKCVARGVRRAHVMADMPFMSYQSGFDEAVKNAGALIKAGAESVKIEGGEAMAKLVSYLSKIGVPVMAHVGLMPQSIHAMGGYKIQGKHKKEADSILRDAKAVEEAGAFSLLIEGVPLEVAQQITSNANIPTIGIGSGPHCDGQVLVCYDLLGTNPNFSPRFVKKYANFHGLAQKAFGEFIAEVKSGEFPAKEHSYERNLVAVTPLKKTR